MMVPTRMPTLESASDQDAHPGRAACWRVTLLGQPPAFGAWIPRGDRTTWTPIIDATSAAEAFAKAETIFPGAELTRPPERLHGRHRMT